jgi:hypothetical protein
MVTVTPQSHHLLCWYYWFYMSVAVSHVVLVVSSFVLGTLLTRGSLVTDGRVTQNFRKEKMRSNNPNDGNYLLLWGVLLKLMSSNVL